MPTRKIRNSSPGIAVYKDFLSSVKPIGIGLKESSSRLDRKVLFALRKVKDSAIRTIQADYELIEIGEKQGYFEATGAFALSVADAKSGNAALSITCTYMVHFHCATPVDRKLAERFAGSELRLVLWPFFREFVFNMCGKMSIPPITIPLSTR